MDIAVANVVIKNTKSEKDFYGFDTESPTAGKVLDTRYIFLGIRI